MMYKSLIYPYVWFCGPRSQLKQEEEKKKKGETHSEMKRISILAHFLQKPLLQMTVGLGFLWNGRIGLKSVDVKIFSERKP